jgi:UDP-N-acetylglucosamine--N-acetylmuramyl-(pentapeptide) pyrophosphoryl-undecaprenol N-acetylglucosamine transferase
MCLVTKVDETTCDKILLHMRIGFVGGGTGGHFYPLMAVAEELSKLPVAPQMYYFGPSPYSPELLKQHNITFISCPAGKLRLYFSIQNFFDLFRSFFGVFVAIWKLYVIYPDVIFSKGGYTSVPILQAARFLRIPVVIHESDAVPGRANKLAKKFARYIGIAHNHAAQFFPPEKTALVGIPLRKEILTTDSDPFTKLGIPNDMPLIYVTGGSLGAERLNTIIFQSLTELLPRYRIFHQAGADKLDNLKFTAKELLKDSPLQANYYVDGLIPPETVSLLMDAASVVITRAGSTTLFEIAAHGKPAIVIPIPEDISRDQRSNAFSYAHSGAASVLEEHNLTPHLLMEEIDSIISSPTRYAAMSAAARELAVPDAAVKIARILLQIGQEHES